MNLIEKAYKKKTIYSGRAVGFAADEILLPDGKKAVREYLVHPGAVAVLPFIDKTHTVLVKQYRYPVREITFELPAGKLNKGENLVSCVRRELAEETGYLAGRVKKILSFWPTPAFSDEIIHIFTAERLASVPRNPDEDEFIETQIVTLQQALKMIKTGRIRDSKTVIALLAWASRLK